MKNQETKKNSRSASHVTQVIDAQEPDCRGVTYEDAASLLHGIPYHGADGHYLSREITEFEQGEYADAGEALCEAVGW